MFPSGNRFVPSLEALGERLTPASTDPGYIGNIIGQYGWVFPAPEDGGGEVANLTQPGGNDSIWIDMGAPVQSAGGPVRYFNGFVSRFPAGDSNETITIGGARTETDVYPTILLQRLANPSLPAPTPDNPVTFTTDPRGSGV